MGASATKASIATLSVSVAASSSMALRPAGAEVAILAGGCFWCVESALEIVSGVHSTRCGYIGGHTRAPVTYESICRGDTGHAEAVEVVFDPAVLPFPRLLAAFFAVHDPTTLNRQGNDSGTQYRSAIFYTSPAQRDAAAAAIAELGPSYRAPIVTEVAAGPPDGHAFHAAEEYHNNYFSKNPNSGYCRATIPAKIAKLHAKFGPEALK